MIVIIRTCATFCCCCCCCMDQVPNILGFVFGLFQILVYFLYKNVKKLVAAEEPKLQELTEQMIDVVTLSAVTEVTSLKETQH